MKTNTIPYGRQTISQTNIDTVVEGLRSDFLTQTHVHSTAFLPRFWKNFSMDSK